MFKKQERVSNLVYNQNENIQIRFYRQSKHYINTSNGNISSRSKNISNFENQLNTLQLRGGGCGLSNFCRSGQFLGDQEITQTIQLNEQNHEQKTIQYNNLPDNFLEEFKASVTVIQEGFSNLISKSKKNEVIIKIQWFIYHKQFFNKLCIEPETYCQVKEYIKSNLQILLETLPNYLDVSWCICYQIAQVCNDLLRIIYSQDKNLSIEESKPFLKQVTIFSEQLKSQSNNIWKSGLEFEKTLMEIMLQNCEDVEQEKKLLIDVGKNTVKSILKMKITDALMSSLKKSAKYLIKKTINKAILYPIKVYQIYYLFQLIKWKIIEDETESVYTSIQNLKSLFQKYIQESDNWILHFCWIQTVTDIIQYRLIIEKEQQQKLLENISNISTIQQLSFNSNQAILLFFDISPNILEASISQKYNKLQLLCSSLIEQQFGKEQNLWDYYSNFHFSINQVQKNFQKIYNHYTGEEDDSKQFNIIQVNREYELLEKQFKQLTILIDQMWLIKTEIEESLINQALDKKTQLSQQLFEEHKIKLSNKFLDTWKKAIYLINLINDILLFDYQKAKLFQINSKNKKLSTQLNEIHCFVLQTFPQFQLNFFSDYLIAIEYINNLVFLDYNQSDIQQEINKINQKYQFKNIQNIQFNDFYKFLNDLNTFQADDHSIVKNDENEVKNDENENENDQNEVKNNQNENEIEIEVQNNQNQVQNNENEIQNNQNQVVINEQSTKDLNLFFTKIIEGTCIKTFVFILISLFEQKFQFINDKLDTDTNDEICNKILKCEISISTLSFLKQFYEVQQVNIKRMKIKLLIYQDQSMEQTQKCEINYNQRFIDQLKKQHQNVITFQDYINKDLDFNILKFKQNFKQIDSEIKQDINDIKIELQQIQDFNPEQQTKTQQYLQALNLLHDLQIIFIIFFNEMNEITNSSQDLTQNINVQEKQNSENQNYDPKLKLKNELEKQKSNFQKFIQEVEQKTILEQEGVLQSKDKKITDETNGINICENQYKENENIIKTIKRAKNYYQSYQKLLLIYLDLKKQQENINIKQQEQKDTTLLNYQEKINNFHNLNRKYIDQLKKSFQDQNKQQIKININLTEIQFLTFFEMEIHDDQREDEVEDEINIALIQEIKDYFNQKKDQVESLIEAKDYKVRECLVYNLIRLQNSNLENQIINFSSRRIQQIWVYEKDQRVRNLLKNKELIEMQKQIFSRDLQTMSDQIKEEIQQKMQNLENLQQQIRLQGNSSEREKLQLQLTQCYQQLDDSIENVSEMSDSMNISLMFLKDILKDVKSIKTSIDNLQNSIQDIGNDIRKLRGKKFDELLEIRKQKILSQVQQQKVDSIYVQLQTIERNPISGNEQAGSFLLRESIQDKDGEVNEFIWHENLGTVNAEDKDVMLISGFAGSGKSRAAKKIEELIWKSQGTQSEWIPIYVSLPTLKNPKYNLLDQALETENYQFDKYQIKEFKDAIRKKKVKVVLILDSYDEMKSDCIQQNLIMTNKLIQDLNIEKENRQVKIIITTRREILNSKGYEAWFYGESLKTLKEVLLLNFNQEQQNKYLEKYCKLSIKRTIRGIYEFVKSVSGQTFDLIEFLKIWNSIINQVKQLLNNSKLSDSDSIFQDEEEEIIIKKLKQQSIFQFLSEEQITGLRKDLLSLWSVNKFKKSIQIINIQHLLTTPFMLEIVVQVLPTMTKKYQGSPKIKEIFKINYLYLKQRAKISKKKRQSIQLNQQNQIQQNNSQGSKSLNKNSKIKRTQKQNKIDNIIDILESKQFFQVYSIDSKIDYQGRDIILDGQNLQLNIIDTDVIIMALKMKKFTAFEFYESFINFYHESQIQKQRELGKISNYESFALDIYQFSSSLALDMTIRDLSQISYKQKGQLLLESNYKATKDVDNWLDQYLSNSNSDNDYKKLIRSCILLSAKGSTYQYTHKSIQEFFVAQYIYNFILSLENFPQSQNQLTVQELANLDRLRNSLFNFPTFNISNDSFRGACSMIKDVLLDTENINQKMIKIVEQSRNIEFCRASSNIIYLLAQMNIYLGSQKFDSIQLTDTNISGLSFFESDLSKSKFKNVTINSCNFNQSNLSDILWDDVICKEQPYLTGQDKCYQALSFSPDGKYLVSGGESGIVKLWDLQNYKFLQDLVPDCNQEIKYLQFSSDSSFLISCSENGIIKKWDMPEATQQQTRYLRKLLRQIKKFVLSQDSSTLYIQFGDIFQILLVDRLFEEIEENIQIIWQYDSDITHYVMSPINSTLAISSSDNNVRLISFNNQLIKQFDKIDSDISVIVFSQDGKQLAIAYDCNIQIWDLQTDQCTHLQTDYEIKYLNISPDCKNLIIGGLRTISIREIEELKVTKEIMAKVCQEVCLCPTQDQIIAIVIQNAIEIINLTTQKSQNKREFQLQPKQISISQDGQKVALMLYDQIHQIEFQILDFNTLKTIVQIQWNHEQWDSHILSTDFNRMLINLTSKQKTLELDLQVIKQLNEPGKHKQLNFEISQLCIKAKSQIIAYVEKQNDNSIILYDFVKQQQIGNKLENNEKYVNCLCFSPTENILVVGYQDSQLIIWNLNTLETQQIQVKEDLSIYYFFNFSPNGKLFVIHSFENLYVYETQNWKQIFELKIQYQYDKQIYFSFDSQLMALTSQNQLIIWDIQNNYKQIELPGLQFTFQQIYFTPNKQIVIFTDYHNLIIFNTSTQNTQQLNLGDTIECISISQNGSTIAIALYDQKGLSMVQIWNYVNNKLECILSEIFYDRIDYLSFVNDDKQLLLKLQKVISYYVIICQIDQFQFKRILKYGFTCGTFSQNNEQIALGRDEQINILSNELSDYSNHLQLNHQNDDMNQFHFNYENQITFVSFSNRNSLFISGNYNGEIKFWNLQDQQIKISYKISNKPIRNLKFIKDESIFINLDQQKVLIIGNVSDTQDNIKLDFCGYYEQINSFSTSQDGKMLIAIRNEKQIMNLNYSNLKYGQFNIEEVITKICYSFSLEFLGVIQQSNLLKIIQQNPQKCYQIKDVKDVTFHPKENLMAIYTQKQIQLIQLQDQKQICCLNFSNDQFSRDRDISNDYNDYYQQNNRQEVILKFSDNGEILLYITDSLIRWYLLEENKSLRVLGCYPNVEQFENVLFFQNKYLAFLSQKKPKYFGQEEQNQTIDILNIVKKNTCFLIESHPFSMDQEEQRIYFASTKSIYIFDLQKLTISLITIKSRNFSNIQYIQAIDDNQLILLNNNDIYLINLTEQGQIFESITQLGTQKKYENVLSHYFSKQKLWAVFFSEDSNDVTYQSSNIQLWSIASKKMIANLQGHRQKINCLNSSNDGLVLGTASDDKTIRLWNIDVNEQYDFSIGHKNIVNVIAFSKDGLLIASGSSDNTIILWDFYEKKYLNQLEDHKAKINFIEFSYCSKLLYSGSDNMTILIWDIINPMQSKILFIINSLDYSAQQICLSPTNPNLFSVNLNKKLCFFNKEMIKEQNYQLLPVLGYSVLGQEKQCFSFINNNEFIYLSREQGFYKLLLLNIINGISTQISESIMFNEFFKIINSKNSNELIILNQSSYETRQFVIMGIDSNKNQINSNQVYLPNVKNILLSPDQNTLVLETNQVISFWDFKLIKKQVLNEEILANSISGQAFFQSIIETISLDSSYVVINDQIKIKLYRIDNKENKNLRDDNQNLEFIIFSFDTKYLAAIYQNEDSTIYYWEVKNPENYFQLNEENNANLITFQFSLTNSNNIYAAYRNGKILIWNLQTKTHELFINYDQTDIFQLDKNHLIFSNKFNYLFTISEQKIINLRMKTQIELNAEVIMIEFSEDETQIAYVDENQLWLSQISNSNLNVIDQITLIYSGNTFSIKFQQDQKLIIGQRDAIQIYDIKEKLKIVEFFEMYNSQYQIKGFIYNSIKQQITIFTKTDIKLFNVSNRIIGQSIDFNRKTLSSYRQIIPQKQLYCFSQDNQYFAILNPKLSLYNAKKYELIRSYEYQGELLAFQQCKSSLILAIASDLSLIFLDLSNLNDIKEIQNIKFEHSILSISLTEKYCLTNHSEDQVILYNIQNLNEVFKQDVYIGNEGILSDDGEYLAYVKQDKKDGKDDEFIKIVKIYQKRIYEVQNISKDNINSIDLISHSPCGQYLALVQYDSIISRYQDISKQSAQVQILDLNSLKIINQENIPIDNQYIVISENWKFMVLCSELSIQIWEINNKNQFYKKEEKLQFDRKDGEDKQNQEDDMVYHEKYYTFLSISLSQTGDYLVSGNKSNTTAESLIALWDVKIGKIIAQSGNLDSFVSTIKFCPDGIHFAAGLDNGHVNLYLIRKSQNQNQDIQILCYKLIGRQSLIQAHQCMLSEQSKIYKSKKSILDLLIQKGAIQNK